VPAPARLTQDMHDVCEEKLEPLRRGAAQLYERLALAAAFLLLAARYWLTIYPHVHLHLRTARARAQAIRDLPTRTLVLASLAKRSNIEGAAAFAALAPRATRKSALQALLGFQAIYNYADVLAEQPGAGTLGDARRAHLPLLSALGAGSSATALYLNGPWMRDTGYLAELLTRTRNAFAELPSSTAVRASALSSASDIVEFQAHSRCSALPAELARWARARPPRAHSMSWPETAAACGSSLTVHALIAAAATPGLRPSEVQRLASVYGGPVGALHSMLDSLIDEAEDAAIGQPSLIALYPSRRAAADAMGQLAADARRATRGLVHGRQHAVLLAAMTSLYLSDSHARTPGSAPIANAVRTGVGRLTTPAMAVFVLRALTARHGTPVATHNPVPEARVELSEPDPERPAGACARAC
jgi:hypothetical protein